MSEPKISELRAREIIRIVHRELADYNVGYYIQVLKDRGYVTKTAVEEARDFLRRISQEIEDKYVAVMTKFFEDKSNGR